jgi:hypothetical protein
VQVLKEARNRPGVKYFMELPSGQKSQFTIQLLDSLDTVMSHEMSANAKVVLKPMDIKYERPAKKAPSKESEDAPAPKVTESVSNNDKPAKEGVFDFDSFIFTLEPGRYAFLEI